MSGSAYRIEGLIKWVHRDEWRGAFDQLFDRHVGAACRNANVEIDELAEIIGENGMSNLWGWAFEDFASSGPSDRNAADDFLKRRGWKESAGSRSYIQALRCSVVSLYEVSAIIVGESFLARDLVRGGDPMRVMERSATRSLAPWDRIAVRIVSVLGKTQISGAVLAFSHDLSDKALGSIERVGENTRAETLKLVRSLGKTIDEGDVASIAGQEEVLRNSAFMFSNLWLSDALQRALQPSLPQMQNSDGDPLEFITLHFPLAPKVSAVTVGTALDGIAQLRRESETFWNWLDVGGRRRRTSREKAVAARVFKTAMDDGALVLGNVELRAKSVTLSVNSESRADHGRALLAAALQGLIGEPLSDRQTVEQMMASSRGKDDPRSLTLNELDASEERQIIHDGITRHYRQTLDQPVPTLGNVSPRKAAKTANGRPKVISWLKMVENRSAQLGPKGPVGKYDFTWMWEELGLLGHRR